MMCRASEMFVDAQVVSRNLIYTLIFHLYVSENEILLVL